MRHETTMKLGAGAVLALLLIVMMLFSPRNAAAKSEGWSDVGLIYVDTNGCTDKLTTELMDHDFALTNQRGGADAVLKVDVHQLDAHTGASARYTATLRDSGGKILVNTSGREDAISQKKLCSNITDDVLDRLSDKPKT